jgi:hypothetical protein
MLHEIVGEPDDLPIDVHELIATFGAEKDFNFDFTLLLSYSQPQLWSILTMQNL